jgi:hypothetical protein
MKLHGKLAAAFARGNAIPVPGRGNQVPKAMTGPTTCVKLPGSSSRQLLEPMTRGFDWLEFFYGHGYLLSGFICPLTNTRSGECGGATSRRGCRYPLEVFGDACGQP